MNPEPITLVSDLAFPEGPRWHDGWLYFSDMHNHKMWRVREDGPKEVVAEFPHMSSGLGWLPDGRMLVVSMTDRALLREDGGVFTKVADLSDVAEFHCNDMVVDSRGRAYIGNFGFDLDGGGTPKATGIIFVDTEFRVSRIAEDVWFPNGHVISPDGRTLILAETFGHRLTAFDIADEGSLSNRRVFAGLDGDVYPDGICLDAEGAVWVACATSECIIRVREGGEVAAMIALPGRRSYACMLGGEDRKTLFICTSTDSRPEKTRELQSGRIEILRVDVPGAGLP
ncbi:MAG: SMP-30/gluconolactonase/LRE family protein [Bryobacteraceae bacterium]